MKTASKHELTLRIILENPTLGVAFGIQQGKGVGYQTIQVQTATGDDLYFEITILAALQDHSLNLSGTLVQGPPNDRFIYIDIGTAAGQHYSIWSRRLKVSLMSLTAEMVQKVMENPAKQLEIRVPGVGKDGSPNCGGFRAANAWKVI